MVRIDGKTYDCIPNYHAGENGADIEITFPLGYAIPDEELLALKSAALLEELEVNYGKVGGVVAAYNLVGWKAIENRNGLRVRWQTYRTTDLEALKQENEDLTRALLELAEIVGGGNG